MSEAMMSRAELGEAELPPYPGIALADICLVNSETLADEARAVLCAADVIGFDTESKPTFRKGEVSTGPHLVQLATEERAFLFQVQRLGSNAALKAILEAPRLLKVGFGLGNDHSVLKTRLDIAVCNVIDLGEVLRGPGHRGTVGAKVAVAHFFGQKLQKSKKVGTSNWASPQLNERQLRYAADDAQVALRVYRAWLQSRREAVLAAATPMPSPLSDQ